MNARLKSLFIFPAAIVLILIVIVSAIMAILDSDQRVAWIGAAISALPLPILIAMMALRPTPRTSENLTLLMFVGAIGLVVAWWQYYTTQAGWVPAAVASAAALLFIMYNFWFSRFGRFDSAQLMVGNKLPEFSLKDKDGNAFESSSLLGAPAVVLFFRGNWCPLCMAQIDEIAGRYQDMAALGIRVVLISPQSSAHSIELAERHDVPFTVLVDEGNRVAESLNIDVKNGVPLGIKGYAPETVLPTVVVTNDKGTILFSDQTDNYRVRPEPDIFLAILRRAGALAK